MTILKNIRLGLLHVAVAITFVLINGVLNRVMIHDLGILASVVIGVVGSFLGGLISTFLTGSNQSYLAFSWTGVFWSFIGSIVLVAILNFFTSRRQAPSV